VWKLSTDWSPILIILDKPAHLNFVSILSNFELIFAKLFLTNFFQITDNFFENFGRIFLRNCVNF
jgi:hypothetical protein